MARIGAYSRTSGAVAELPASDRPRIEGSDQQVAFWGALEETYSHVILEARAGTGKSTSCREAIWRLAERDPLTRSVYVAFNRSIAQDFQRGLPLGAKALTLHSAGYAACRANLRLVGDPDKDKLNRLISIQIPRSMSNGRTVKASIRKLVELCKVHLTDGTDTNQLNRIAARHGVYVPSDYASLIFSVVAWVLAESLKQESTVDFTDMIWFPVMKGFDFEPVDFLFVDEAQDLDPLQHAFVLGMLRGSHGARAAVVGDPWQAIYAFRGADSRSIDTIHETLSAARGGCRRLPLTKTRRCPQSHVRLAAQLVPDFEALPEAPEGEVAINCGDSEIRRGTMVLCRNNAPLVSLCFGLVSRGERVAIQGKDLGEGLVELVDGFRARSVADLMKKVCDYRDREIEKLVEIEGADEDIAQVRDRADCILAVCNGADNCSQVTSRIESLFADVDADHQDDYTLLSSIHRAKGRESDRVVIYAPEKIPSKAAKTPEAMRQEVNLCYVALTRSKDFLGIHGGDVPFGLTA